MGNRNGQRAIKSAIATTAALLALSAAPAQVTRHTLALSIAPAATGVPLAGRARRPLSRQGPMRLPVGGEVALQVEVHGARDLFSAPFYLIYDPRIVSAQKVSEGTFLKHGGRKTVFLNKVDSQRGEIVIGLSQMGDRAGVTGNAPLVFVTFKAIRAGRSPLVFQNVHFKDSRRAPIDVQPNVGWIEVE